MLCNRGPTLVNALAHTFIHSPHLQVRATTERFLSAGGTFKAILASESHWLQPRLVLSVHWWLAPAGVGSVLESQRVLKGGPSIR